MTDAATQLTEHEFDGVITPEVIPRFVADAVGTTIARLVKAAAPMAAHFLLSRVDLAVLLSFIHFSVSVKLCSHA